MKDRMLHQRPRLARIAGTPRRLLWGLSLAGLSWIGAGCSQFGAAVPSPSNDTNPPASLGKDSASQPGTSEGAGAVVRTSDQEPITLPAAVGDDSTSKPGGSAKPPTQPAPESQGSSQPVLPPPSLAPEQSSAIPLPHQCTTLPINLDTVLRLAEEQNAKLNLDREKVHEAQVQEELADKAWLPDVYVGMDYWRHDGGIVEPSTGVLFTPDFNAMFAGLEVCSKLDLRELTYQKVKAQSNFWQQSAEKSKMTHDKLLETASAYIDLLAARTAEVWADEIGVDLKKLYDSAVQLADVEPPARVFVPSLKAALRLHYQSVLRLRQEGNVASARLAYLLDLDSCTVLVPVDDHLIPLDLVDPNQCCDALVEQALVNGPGVQETQALIATIQHGIDQSHGPGKFLPVFELKMAEGGFGAGPDDTMTWANRFDIGLSVKWDLTNLCTAKLKSQQAQTQLSQAQYGYEDLRGQLGMAVRESRDVTLNGLAQIQVTRQAIAEAREAYRLSRERFDLAVRGRSFEEVIQQVKQLQSALSAHLQAVSDYDKAQLELKLLLGGAECGHGVGEASGLPIAPEAAQPGDSKGATPAPVKLQ